MDCTNSCFECAREEEEGLWWNESMLLKMRDMCQTFMAQDC